MAERSARCIAVVGHSSTGKTTLTERLLVAAKAIHEPGTIDKGNTVCDSDPIEKERQVSINSAVTHCSHAGTEINIIDTPGYSDFLPAAVGPLAVSDLALVTVSASEGIQLGTRRTWAMAEGLPRAVAITKADAPGAEFGPIVDALKEAFGVEVAPCVVPAPDDPAKVVNLLGEGDVAGDLEELRGALIESVISSDDDLLERYLGDEKIGADEIEGAFGDALVAGTVVPVFWTSAEKGLGLGELLDFFAKYVPDVGKIQRRVVDGEEIKREAIDPSGAFTAHVFKVMTDDYVGKVSFFRALGGKLNAGDTVTLLPDGGSVKVGKLHRYQGGGRPEDVSSAATGDVVATSKIDEIGLGATLSGGKGKAFAPLELAEPMVSAAVSPVKSGDETKMTEALRKLAAEDPGFKAGLVPQTKEMVMSGMSQLHLDIQLQRLKDRYGVEVVPRPPKIAYLETISKECSTRYRHKKQTGGAGQFAECEIILEPNERGAGYEFLDEIRSGTISQPFRQSVDKGVRAAMAEGVIAGYPVVDVKLRLVDGKEHPVDSKDIAFQIAGRMAFREAVQKGAPVLLEPIVIMEVAVPAQFMGDITGDISGKRGRVTGMESVGDLQVIKVQVPAAEVQRYSTDLKAITGGEGSYTMSFSHYDPIPQQVSQGVIQRAKKEKA